MKAEVEIKQLKKQLENVQQKHHDAINQLSLTHDAYKQEHQSMHENALKTLQSEHQAEVKELKETTSLLQDQVNQLSEQLEVTNKTKQTAIMSLGQAHLDQVHVQACSLFAQVQFNLASNNCSEDVSCLEGLEVQDQAFDGRA
jgi:hypothetical protein